MRPGSTVLLGRTTLQQRPRPAHACLTLLWRCHVCNKGLERSLAISTQPISTGP